MTLSAGTKLGPYEIQAPVGAGGMGEVYRARDARLNRTVAVKILPAHLATDPEAKQRFEHEARAISSLNHPNICTVHDVGQQNGKDFLVMEYLEGETLAHRLRKEPLPIEAVLKYGIEICEGLERAHRSGVIHRDLKPANIMLTKSGLKVMDFGLAKAVTPTLAPAATAESPAHPTTPTISLDSITFPALTQAGTIVGTFQYLAPEVLRGSAADARSDVFSLGCVLYEMVTARPAFEGKSQITVLAAILEREPDPVADIRTSSPPALNSVIRACLAKDPEERTQSAHDVKLQLRMVTETSAAKAEATFGHKVAYLSMATALLIGLIIGAATMWFLRVPSQSVPEPAGTELSISLPEMSLSPLSAPMISPDGDAVAFVAKTADSPDSLYTRRLDTRSVRRFEDTEMARHPFWSPDSASVAFFAGTQLKKVDLASGTVQVIAEAADGRGGSWSKQGVIVFSPFASSPLLRVDASGGTVRPLTELNGQVSHRWPSFLADGRHFVYTAQPGTEAGGIFLASLDDPRGQLLTSEVSSGHVANGYLLFGRGATVVASKLDVTSGKLSGDGTVIAERVRAMPDRLLSEFSVCNGTLTYAPGDTDLFELGWFDRTGRVLERMNARDVRGELDLSPDGQHVLTDYFTPTGRQSVEIIDLQRGTANPVAGMAFLESPLWSPTGESVIFGRKDIVRRWIDGSDREQVIVKSTERVFPDDWSKDGRWLLFERVGKQTNFDLMRLDLTSKTEREPEPYLQTTANEAHGRISPDGHWVAYVSDDSGHAEVYVQSFPQTGGGKWRISTKGGDQPFWRGDGGELYYLAPDLAIMAVSIRRGKSFDPGVPIKLFQTTSVTWGVTGNRNSYVATPDGKRFLVQYIPEHAGGGTIGIIENWEQRLKGAKPPQTR